MKDNQLPVPVSSNSLVASVRETDIESTRSEFPHESVDEYWSRSSISKFRAYAAICMMSFGTFSCGVNEFLMPSLLPELEDDFSISITTAAWVSTSFMISLSVSSPIVTALTINQPRKYLLMSLLTILVASTTISALTPSFPILLAARILSSFGHASYMAVGSYVANKLVPESQQASASSYFFLGITMALTMGVPLGTLLADKVNWRYSYWIVTGFSVLSLLGVTFMLPKNIEQPKINLRGELQMFRKPEVWLALATSAFGYSGMLSSHTYFSNMMTELAGYNDSDLAWLAFIYGIGTLLGNVFGGKMADRNLLGTLRTMLFSLAAVLLGFNWAANYKIPATIALFLNGFTGFSVVSPLMRYVSSKTDDGGSTMASASCISSFGGGIAAGIYLGGLGIDKGFGFSSPNWIGSALTMFGLLFMSLNEFLYGSKTQNKDMGKDQLKDPLLESGLQSPREDNRGGIFGAKKIHDTGIQSDRVSIVSTSIENSLPIKSPRVNLCDKIMSFFCCRASRREDTHTTVVSAISDYRNT